MARPLKVGVLGATGLVGRAACASISRNPMLHLGTVCGSKASDRADYQAVWERKEQDLVQHYGSSFWKPMPFPREIGRRTVATFEQLLESDDDVVFSSIPLRAGGLEDKLLEAGKFVVSNSPYRRFEEGIPVVVSEVNGGVLQADHRYVKSPNCCTNGIVLTLKPIFDRYGIEECSLTTYQAISGRGDLKYERHLVDGNVYPIGRTEENTEEYIKKEVRKIFDTCPSAPSGCDFKISVSCQRVQVQKNHFVDVKLKLRRRPESKEEVLELWEGFNPLSELAQSDLIAHKCTQPLMVVDRVGYPRSVLPGEEGNLGMSVMVGNTLVDDEMFDLRYNLVVDNLDRGAYGGPLQNAELVLKILNNPTEKHEQLLRNIAMSA